MTNLNTSISIFLHRARRLINGVIKTDIIKQKRLEKPGITVYSESYKKYKRGQSKKQNEEPEPGPEPEPEPSMEPGTN